MWCLLRLAWWVPRLAGATVVDHFPTRIHFGHGILEDEIQGGWIGAGRGYMTLDVRLGGWIFFAGLDISRCCSGCRFQV